MDVKVFDNGDKPYLEWLIKNPNGYVLNRRRGKSESYLVLHRSSCRFMNFLTGEAKMNGFTGRSYIKVCSESVSDLSLYIKVKGGCSSGAFSKRCGTCKP